MATAYLAWDLKHDRQVAVKVLRPELGATLGPDRFLRQIRIAANLHHPHILPLYDSGEADGFLFYVMPYEQGHFIRGPKPDLVVSYPQRRTRADVRCQQPCWPRLLTDAPFGRPPDDRTSEARHKRNQRFEDG
jgi:serine/threonine protein kinase